mgnify:CR=1 FL=1
MTLVRHELRQGKTSLLIWTASIGFLLAICVFLFPEMKGQMDGISDVFASMGSFTAAFGMDRLNFGTLVGFYAIECGNVLGLGGAFYAALCAVGILSGVFTCSSCQTDKDYHRKADCCSDSNNSVESNYLCHFRRLHGYNRGGDSLGRNKSVASCLLSASN